MANDGPFLFYSALHGRPVRDPDGNVVGRLDDLAVTLTETFPAATALLIRRGRVESFRLTARWRDVESVDLAAVRLRVPVERLVPGRRLPSEPSFWVGQVLLDRQIVDTAGAKVVRVNDLHFLRVASGELHLVGDGREQAVAGSAAFLRALHGPDRPRCRDRPPPRDAAAARHVSVAGRQRHPAAARARAH